MIDQDLNNDIREIKDALMGSGLFKDNGIIDRVANHERRLDRHDKIFWMVLGGWILLVVLTSAISYNVKASGIQKNTIELNKTK